MNGRYSGTCHCWHSAVAVVQKAPARSATEPGQQCPGPNVRSAAKVKARPPPGLVGFYPIVRRIPEDVQGGFIALRCDPYGVFGRYPYKGNSLLKLDTGCNLKLGGSTGLHSLSGRECPKMSANARFFRPSPTGKPGIRLPRPDPAYESTAPPPATRPSC